MFAQSEEAIFYEVSPFSENYARSGDAEAEDLLFKGRLMLPGDLLVQTVCDSDTGLPWGVYIYHPLMMTRDTESGAYDWWEDSLQYIVSLERVVGPLHFEESCQRSTPISPNLEAIRKLPQSEAILVIKTFVKELSVLRWPNTHDLEWYDNQIHYHFIAYDKVSAISRSGRSFFPTDGTHTLKLASLSVTLAKYVEATSDSLISVALGEIRSTSLDILK